MVRLITHNLLACHVKGCNSNNFPLAFDGPQIEIREAEFNSDFLMGFFPKIEWSALVNASRQLGDQSLPEQQPDAENIDDALLKALHHVLLEIHVENGKMICPNCSHIYPISNGIPNMLLAEHEIA
ncbi:Trm112p-domain-containing protein [Gautieria morchelliformis]|nr:Trm112p-domain-containing protein [Gautieria morchelliformis]